MKRMTAMHSRIGVSAALCAGLLISAPIPGVSMVASASNPVATVSNIAEALSRVKIASTTVRKLEKSKKYQSNIPRSGVKSKLRAALVAQKRAEEVFQTLLNQLLVWSPNSLKLLGAFALAFNTRMDALQSLTESELDLRNDQKTVQFLQKAINALVTGGQSDMNSELGSMRLKLSQTSSRIPADQAVVSLTSMEIALATKNLNEATESALADPISSIALNALVAISPKSSHLTRLRENALTWNWASS